MCIKTVLNLLTHFTRHRVSSHQLDETERGLVTTNAPLDMRMDRRNELNAKTIVNEYSFEEIRDIVKNYGEERWASRIAVYCKGRETRPIEMTEDLVEIIKAAIPESARRKGPHPAKRTFQALRIAVNDELGVLKELLTKDRIVEAGRKILHNNVSVS